MSSEKFNESIIALIQEHHPAAMKGDINSTLACAAEMSVALGGMLAFAHRLNGQVVARTVLQSIIGNIIQSAEAIDTEAGKTLRKYAESLKLN